MKLGVLFPGQGSQFVGMGREFIDRLPECEAIMATAESVCAFPLRRLCLDGPLEELTRAAVLQPAITVTNLMCLKALRLRLPQDLPVSCCAGHSLGEFSALCAAGVISVEDTVRLVERRGFFMEREGRTHPGVMRAVLGLSIEAVEAAVAAYQGGGTVTVANYNTPQQIVVAGSEHAVDQVCAALTEQGAKVIALNVSVANHSPLVAGAVPDFAAFLETITFNRPQLPVYGNVTAQPLDNPAAIKEIMARQIISRVRWYESMVNMIDDGVDTFIEV
ncbi:MAG: ACP S-malonyltransferase, partial [Desulfofustis sp.]|nr:ACP S-malonyltransferase [Desulfofustis sp.]